MDVKQDVNKARIASATKRLVQAVGGVAEAAAVISGRYQNVSHQTVSTWQNPFQPQTMPAHAIQALEEHCGDAILSRALVEMQGLAAVPDRFSSVRTELSLQQMFARIVKEHADAMTAFADAIEDEKVTHAEARGMIKELEESIHAQQQARDVLQRLLNSGESYLPVSGAGNGG